MKPDYHRIPRHTLRTLEAWIATGRLDDDGGFHQGLLMNDLVAVIERAEAVHLQALPAICHLLRHHAPRGSYGSPGAIAAWPRVARVAAGSKI